MALTAVRESAGLTVREVARAAGISPSTVGGYFSGRHLPPLRPDGGIRSILGACGVTDPTEVQTWQRALARVRRAPGPRPAALPAPYRGLAAYRPEDVALLFGREKELAQLLDRLRQPRKPAQTADETGLAILLGRAGSGKSSLVAAGLLPRLRAAGRPVTILVPGPVPLQDLATAVAVLTGGDPDATHATLRTNPPAIRTLLQSLPVSPRPSEQTPGRVPGKAAGALESGTIGGDHRPVLVVDRFEALLTAGAKPAEQDAFVRALAAAARREPRTAAPADVLVVLRTEAVPGVAHFPDLASALRTPDDGMTSGPPQVVHLASMDDEALRAVVLGPTRQAGIDVDPGLVDVILADVADLERRGAAVLPRLSHALLTTWRRSRRDRLSLADYQEAGGVLGSVETAAEAVYRSLPDDDRAALSTLLPALLRGEIRDDGPAVVRVLAEAGLLDLPGDRPAPVPVGLLQGWPRLASWTAESHRDTPASAIPGTAPTATRSGASSAGPADQRGTERRWEPGHCPATWRRTPWATVAAAVVVLSLIVMTAMALHLPY